jgi:hypothetical protein
MEKHLIFAAVGYAIDPKRNLSPTPETPIEAVGGVGDRK